MAWRKLAYLDEVASLSNVIPEPVDGTAASAGVGEAASRDDHIHALGPLVTNMDFAKHQLIQAVLHVSAQPPADPVEGQIYYDSTAEDKHVYVFVPA